MYIYIYTHNTVCAIDLQYATHSVFIQDTCRYNKHDEIFRAYLSMYPSIYLCINPSMFLYIYLSISLAIYLSIYLFIYLSVYLSS